MSIRTIDDLSSSLDQEMAWRKRELSDLKYYVDTAVAQSTRRQVLARCGVAILYAHWEGFVKLAGRHFLEYVAMQRHRNDELGENLLTLSMTATVNVLPESRKFTEYGKITQFYLTEMAGRARIPFKTAVDTESNLSSRVLKEIAWCLGIDYSLYATKEKFIDSRLLGRRNHIAHGETTDVAAEEYAEMRDVVIGLMTTLSNQLLNSALTKTYMKA